VSAQRKMIYDRLASPDSRRLIELLYELSCTADAEPLPVGIRTGRLIE
jgi:hypothetical protein